ncbi:hypothetical protein [Stenotrophomonas sp. SORGH_AS_0282]|uniref:hypothetical protein n=1 Tax=Stenotrophomonas sp. SORGH_AS_0282 TaxID=3041763 RepID=UPI00277EEC80|nr:hypothetical protein [Stenotrophomonas sp. SORGH_AS_0282]MDQ1063581.1 hypothetical protein [Stenotrophomonas sp. SORGH_AS_0282]MDQ1188056.1 hypothetical protein [Stenotrophomonas sp. SORGH_AS_0282]
MQLLYATFPDRTPGVGLLLFRLVLSLMLVGPWGLRGALPPPDLIAWAWLAAALIAFGGLLPLGIGVALVLAGVDAALDGWPLAGLLLALLLLGPGAYSVDAVLFGRRVLERPASRRGSDDSKGTHPKE